MGRVWKRSSWRFCRATTPVGRGDWCSEPAYIARLCSSILATDLSCAVCLETMDGKLSPSQLPCAHFMCVDCLKKLFHLRQRGLTCPTCKTHFERYILDEHPMVPGGVCLAEVS